MEEDKIVVVVVAVEIVVVILLVVLFVVVAKTLCYLQPTPYHHEGKNKNRKNIS